MRRMLMSSGALVVLVVAVLTWPIAAAAPTAKPEDVGFSAERLHRISDLIQRHITAGDFSGAVTLVARNGRIAHLEAQGLMDVESRKPMQKDAIFQIMSMTKPVVGTSIMMMVEEGKVRLTDPVSKFIPEFKDLKVAIPMAAAPGAAPAGRGAGAEARYYSVPAEREITIRDLLTHTSGLVSGGLSGTEARKVAVKGKESLADVIPRLGGVPLDFQPGSRWAYSAQAGFDTLARIVEITSGMPFGQFARTRIFEPLGMKDTFFYVPENKVGQLATAYTYYPEKGLNRFPDTPIREGPFVYSADYPTRGPKKLFSGGAGLVSTAMDYARFCQMMLDNGRVGTTRLLSRKSVELMTQDSLGKIGPDQGFGLGFGIDGVKGPLTELGSVGEYSWGGFFYTQFAVDPKEQMIVVFMGQLHPAGDLTLNRKVIELAYQAIND